MQLEKNTILDLLRQRGEHQSADQADQELPDGVDTDQHADRVRPGGSHGPSAAGGVSR